MGFAGGVMLVVSFVNLYAEALGVLGLLEVALSFGVGALFMMAVDLSLPHIEFGLWEDGVKDRPLFNSGMIIAVGSDHAGRLYKARLVSWLGQRHRVKDVGTHTGASVDYPDYAEAVAQGVARRRYHRGILICGTGIGMSIAANKVKGVRAAVVWNGPVARLAVQHNGANVLCLSARFLKWREVQACARAWLTASFEGGRHVRRLRKISQLEKKNAR